jgi:hypothetical protein
MTDYTDLELIAKYSEIEARVSKETTAFNERMAPDRKAMETLKNVLLARLNERGAKNTKTEAGTAYKTHPMDITIIDRNAFLKFCLDNWQEIGCDMMNIGAVAKPVREYIEENEKNTLRKPPPGLQVVRAVRINIRKS